MGSVGFGWVWRGEMRITRKKKQQVITYSSIRRKVIVRCDLSNYRTVRRLAKQPGQASTTLVGAWAVDCVCAINCSSLAGSAIPGGGGYKALVLLLLCKRTTATMATTCVAFAHLFPCFYMQAYCKL